MSASDLPEPGMTSFDYGQRIQWFTADQLRAYGDKRAREAVPEGWKLVPIEPTPEMLKAGDQKTWVLPARDCWDAMLAASPSPDMLEKR